MNIFFSKLLVDVLGSVSVEELVSVENAPSARFARREEDKYHHVLMVLGLM